MIVGAAHEADMTLPSPRASADDAGSLRRAAVVLLAMWAEVEADLVTLTRHVVHDEVIAKAAVIGLMHSNSSVRVESKHATSDSRISVIPVIITIIIVIMTKFVIKCVGTNQIGLSWNRTAPSLLLGPPTSCIVEKLKIT